MNMSRKSTLFDLDSLNTLATWILLMPKLRHHSNISFIRRDINVHMVDIILIFVVMINGEEIVCDTRLP